MQFCVVMQKLSVISENRAFFFFWGSQSLLMLRHNLFKKLTHIHHFVYPVLATELQYRVTGIIRDWFPKNEASCD